VSRNKFHSSHSLMIALIIVASIVAACSNKISTSPVSTTPTPTSTPTTPTATSTPNGFTVSTLAGSGNIGSANGTGTGASFYYPYGVAVDGSGNVYVADTYNELIREISPGGTVTTLSGSGFVGTNPGNYDMPYGVAVDGSGNVYVADTYNQAIRKISGGTASTFAGQPAIPGSTNATGTSARFDYPEGVAVDGSGNVYVADTGNQLIREITPGGVVSTLAGSAGVTGAANGTGTAALFNSPTGVAVDGLGNVYVADSGNDLIRKITSGGVVSILAGSAGVTGSTNGTGASALFRVPIGVAVDGSGNVYVADEYNESIREITPGGVVSTVAGTGAMSYVNGNGTVATFDLPYGVAVDGSGNLYVADTFNMVTRKITP